MKSLHFILSMSVSVLQVSFLTSCNSDRGDFSDSHDTNREESCQVIVPDTSSVLNEHQAINIANYLSREQGSRSFVRTANYANCITDSTGNPLMFVVNYENNQGFVILSADKRYYPVLAKVDSGYLDIDKIPEGHPIQFWLMCQKDEIKHAESVPEELKASISSQWENFDTEKESVLSRSSDPDKPQVYYDSLKRWSQDPSLQVYKYEDFIHTSEYQSLSSAEKDAITANILYKGNHNYGSVESSTIVLRKSISESFSNILLKTRWHQDLPYNKEVPNNYPLGCTTIAAGQIMRYLEQPESINWANMPYDYPTNETQKFLYSLGMNIGVKFGPNGSPADIDKVEKCLKGYGFHVQQRDHYAGNVSTDVRNGFPVYMRGTNNNSSEGHAWVCDGVKYGRSGVEIRVMTIDYRPTTVSIPDLMIEAYKCSSISSTPYFFHYNWGWGGLNDGFFNDANITVSLNGEQVTLNKKRKNLHIRPSNRPF